MTIEKSSFHPLKSNHHKKFELKNIKFKKIKHRKLFVFGILIVSMLIAFAVNSYMPVKAQVLTLSPKEFIKGFTEEGTVVAAQESPLFSPIAGKLKILQIHNGDQVKKNQVVYEMDTTDLHYQLESLNAQLTSLEGQRVQSSSTVYDAQIAQQKLIIEQARKDVQTQTENLEKLKSLFDNGAISKAQYEDAQNTTAKAQNFLEQQNEGLQLMYEQKASPGTAMYYMGQKEALETQISQVKNEIAKAKVLAPQDGIVKDLEIKEGTYLPIGQQILTVFQAQDYQIESFVLANDALSIQPGDSVEIIQDTDNGITNMRGTIKSIDPSAVEKISPLGLKEKRVKIKILLQDNSPIILGSTVDVRYTTMDEPNKLIIPKTAIFPYQQGYAVWTIKNDRAVLQPVQKGLENEHDVIIEQGLAQGDLVLLDINLKNLKEGKRIKPVLSNK